MLALRICQPCSALDFKDAGNVGFAKMSTLFCFGFQGCWECWLCKNVNLVLLWISRMLGTRWQSLTVFFVKTIESNKCGKVNFLQSWAKQWSYCTVIATFSCNRLTAIWFASAPKMTGQTKKPYFNPCY